MIRKSWVNFSLKNHFIAEMNKLSRRRVSVPSLRACYLNKKFYNFAGVVELVCLHFWICLHYYCSSDLDVCQTFKMWLLLFLRIIGYLHELLESLLCVTLWWSEHNFSEDHNWICSFDYFFVRFYPV